MIRRNASTEARMLKKGGVPRRTRAVEPSSGGWVNESVRIHLLEMIAKSGELGANTYQQLG